MARARASLRSFVLLLLVAVALAAFPGAAISVGTADTERGLDLWVHAPGTATGRATIPINVQALGFPTASTTRPLSGAVVEATWDPESLVEPAPRGKGKGQAAVQKPAAAPPSVKVTTDASGRATLELPVPEGSERPITALVSVTANGKQRVRELSIQRKQPANLSVYVSDTRVVPGSDVVAWVLLAADDGARPIPSATVEVRLLQGGLVRFRRDVTTDAAGSAMLRVPVPRDQEPDVSWTIDARAKDAGSLGVSAIPSTIGLVPREETPGKPTLWSAFDNGSVAAGASAKYRIRVEDGSEQAVAGHPVWVWTGPSGTEPPKDEKEFQKVATRRLTDGSGTIIADVTTPTTVPLRGTTVSMVARTELEGQPFEAKSSVEVARAHGSVDLTPEAGDLVPGLEQRVFVRVLDDRGKPIKTKLVAKGDGLDTQVSTDEFGEGQLTWKVPAGIGARREVGPCPGTVAAAVTLQTAPGEPPLALSSLAAPLCVGVDRSAKILVRPEKTIVRAGDKLTVEVVGDSKSPISVLLSSMDGERATATWNAGDARRVEVSVPESMTGVARISAALPGGDAATKVSGTAVLVLPKILPRLKATLVGGRAAPRGTVTLEAVLTDEAGNGLQGTVAAVVIDKFGGGSFGPLGTMDTRAVLCGSVGAEDERCDAVLKEGTETDLYRRMLLRSSAGSEGPTHDPGAKMKEGVDAVFRSVVMSLEGAVYEATASPETLADVRRTVQGKHSFNPELMTLVTEAMDPKPEMPGGEPVTLGDLLAIDTQITFDTVAKRVTRLKLFDALRAVREYRQNNSIDPDEPLLLEPNVLLKKMIREEVLTDAALLDPWGGRIGFYKAGGEVVPFLTVSRGWELRSPGPDGKMGTGDDVKSPFERVLKSGTPYAKAVDEDRLVESRFDMRVADATVEAWGTTLREVTGIALGNIGTLGHGAGTGSGQGFGSGSGRLGGSHRTRAPRAIAQGIAYVSKPVRTDAQGRARIDVTLGDIETTWRIGVVGIPDKARTAVGHVDVPVTVPISSKVFAGSVWTEGDRAEASITVRNRTETDLDISLAIGAEGAFALDGDHRSKRVRVGKQGATIVRVVVRATKAGKGFITVSTSAPGQPTDSLRYEVESLQKGEVSRVARAVYLDRPTDLSRYLSRPNLRVAGGATLVFQRGQSAVLEGALDALSADKLTSKAALTDAVEVAGMIVRSERARAGDGSRLGARAKEAGRAAAAKLLSIQGSAAATPLLIERVRLSGIVSDDELPEKQECPKDPAPTAVDMALLTLEAEPPAAGGAALDCWTQAVAAAKNTVDKAESPAVLARAALALRSRPHRAPQAKAILEKLVARVAPNPAGMITMPSGSSRADTALVYAALVAAAGYEGARHEALVGWLLVQRDARGGFGNAAATRAAVDALAAEARANAAPGDTTVTIDFGEAGSKRATVGADARVLVAVPKNATSVVITADRPGVLARLERDFLRPYDVAPQPSSSGLSITTAWPEDPKVGKVSNLEVALDGGVDTQLVEARIPLPPGATLADAVAGVRQVQGALFVRAAVSSKKALTIPVRFSLTGVMTVREATVAPLERDAGPAIERARPIRVGR